MMNGEGFKVRDEIEPMKERPADGAVHFDQYYSGLLSTTDMNGNPTWYPNGCSTMASGPRLHNSMAPSS